MALAETAKLVVALMLSDQLTPGIKKIERRIGGLGKVGRTAGKGIAAGLAAGAAAGAAAVGVNVARGIDSLVELESAVTSADGAIAQLGLTGKVTGAQIAAWANEIEAASQAAFDDKAITAATANLIRYGKVTPESLREAMVVMTDLAAKTGDVSSASTVLAKALADPAKAAGKLTRMGVVLTEAQQKQLLSLTSLTKEEAKHYKALLKSDKKAAERYKAKALAAKQDKAQSYLLDQIGTSTAGAAAAMNGPMKDAQETLKDVSEDAQRALAKGFLPVLMRVQKGLAKALGDQKTLDAIEAFGQGLANAFDEVVKFAEKIDWGKIGSGLKVAAEWGGKFIGAIAKMPPEVLGALIALGGLNKLSGGAVSGIVGELGKGLIKGVLGMTAGVVNINAATVNGPGGIGGKGGGGLPGLPVAGGLGAAAMAVIAPASIIALGAAVSGALLYGVPAAVAAVYGKPKPEAGVNATSARDPGFQGQRQVNALLANVPRPIVAAIKTSDANQRGEQARLRSITEGVRAKQAESIVAFRAAERTFANQPPPKVSVSTNVRVNVSAANVNKSVVTRARYGTTGGSRDINSGHGK